MCIIQSVVLAINIFFKNIIECLLDIFSQECSYVLRQIWRDILNYKIVLIVYFSVICNTYHLHVINI